MPGERQRYRQPRAPPRLRRPGPPRRTPGPKPPPFRLPLAS